MEISQPIRTHYKKKLIVKYKVLLDKIIFCQNHCTHHGNIIEIFVVALSITLPDLCPCWGDSPFILVSTVIQREGDGSPKFEAVSRMRDKFLAKGHLFQ